MLRMRTARAAATLALAALAGACLWSTSPSEPDENKAVDKCAEPSRNDLERNVCAADADCEYIWFTGGCATPEYVGRVSRQAACEGLHIGEALPRDGVSCTCEKSVCVTHG